MSSTASLQPIPGSPQEPSFFRFILRWIKAIGAVIGTFTGPIMFAAFVWPHLQPWLRWISLRSPRVGAVIPLSLMVAFAVTCTIVVLCCVYDDVVPPLDANRVPAPPSRIAIELLLLFCVFFSGASFWGIAKFGFGWFLGAGLLLVLVMGGCFWWHKKPEMVPIHLGHLNWRKILPGVGLILAVFIVVGTAWTAGRLAAYVLGDAVHRPNLRLHGSNTIGSELAPALAASYLRDQEMTDIQMIPGWSEDQTTIVGTDRYGEPFRIDIQSQESEAAFDDLKNGRTDIAMASTRINPEMSGLDDIRDNDQAEHVIGVVGIAIIARPLRAEKVGKLSMEQVCLIFRGQLDDWKDILHDDVKAPINRYVDSGTRTTFSSICGSLLENKAIRDKYPHGEWNKSYESFLPNDEQHFFQNSQLLSDAVERDPNGIGFVALPWVSPCKALKIGDEGAEAYDPTDSSVRGEEYAFTRRLYLYRRPPEKGDNDSITRFMDFTTGEQGQKIVERSGFVNQEIHLEKPETPSGAPQEWIDVTKKAKRASLAVRFPPNSSEFDAKAKSDLYKLKEYLSSNPVTSSGEHVFIVLGFADRNRGETSFCQISKDRADAVANWLRVQFPSYTIVPAAFGKMLPLTTESTPEGFARNRRAEIWVAEDLPKWLQTTCAPSSTAVRKMQQSAQ